MNDDLPPIWYMKVGSVILLNLNSKVAKMRFKILKQEKPKHQDLVASVGWSNGNELYSIADDMHIRKWDINGEPVRTFLKFE